ncbi:hypothetical protein BDV34DRAFT_54218 [Aspergillus parasiticus]|uniref:Uncharacterized protein n=1 Tax=Aspergillus parasiticus TaxID=5067 RepID=A0A5N6DT26_ASPPA|nr:hypothetical protein BDV34DRAFT_54218 [Aspergillus parasiticus]
MLRSSLLSNLWSLSSVCTDMRQNLQTLARCRISRNFPILNLTDFNPRRLFLWVIGLSLGSLSNMVQSTIWPSLRCWQYSQRNSLEGSGH